MTRAFERAAKAVEICQSATLLPDYGGPVQRMREEQLQKTWVNYDAAIAAYDSEKGKWLDQALDN